MEIKGIQHIASAPKLLLYDILLEIVKFDQSLLHISKGQGLFYLMEAVTCSLQYFLYASQHNPTCMLGYLWLGCHCEHLCCQGRHETDSQ